MHMPLSVITHCLHNRLADFHCMVHSHAHNVQGAIFTTVHHFVVSHTYYCFCYKYLVIWNQLCVPTMGSIREINTKYALFVVQLSKPSECLLYCTVMYSQLLCNYPRPCEYIVDIVSINYNDFILLT